MVDGIMSVPGAQFKHLRLVSLQSCYVSVSDIKMNSLNWDDSLNLILCIDLKYKPFYLGIRD